MDGFYRHARTADDKRHTPADAGEPILLNPNDKFQLAGCQQIEKQGIYRVDVLVTGHRTMLTWNFDQQWISSVMSFPEPVTDKT
jgi:hypothetical protein